MNGLYSLPEKPSAHDIIKRSIIAHPSLYRESLIKQAEMHDDYSKLSRDPRATQGAIAQKNACLKIYDFVGADLSPDEAATEICRECGSMVVALNAAGKLQCLPRHLLTAAAVQWDEEHAA
jgi:hypothetical protein